MASAFLDLPVITTISIFTTTQIIRHVAVFLDDLGIADLPDGCCRTAIKFCSFTGTLISIYVRLGASLALHTGAGYIFKHPIFEPGEPQCANACGFFNGGCLGLQRDDIMPRGYARAKGNGSSAGATGAVHGMCRRG
jgi:hypothetical protein